MLAVLSTDLMALFRLFFLEFGKGSCKRRETEHAWNLCLHHFSSLFRNNFLVRSSFYNFCQFGQEPQSKTDYTKSHIRPNQSSGPGRHHSTGE